MNPSDQPKQRRGCMFYGCIVGLILFLLVLVGVGVGYLSLRKAMNTWTDTKPIQLPQTELSQAETSQVQQRIDHFTESLTKGDPAEPLALSAREINGLISNSPDLAQLKGKIHITLDEGQARGQVSIPLNETGIGFMKGRYLNGAGTIKTTLEGGKLHVTLDNVEVKGTRLPDSVMSSIQGVNFAQAINDDPKAAAVLGKLQGIEVKDGKIVIVPQAAK